MLSGYKTYLVAAGIALATGAKYLGWIDESLYGLVIGLLSGGGFASLRAGVISTLKKQENRVVENVVQKIRTLQK